MHHDRDRMMITNEIGRGMLWKGAAKEAFYGVGNGVLNAMRGKIVHVMAIKIQGYNEWMLR